MEVCGWLTVKQLVMFQTTLMVQKTLQTSKPYYLNTRLNTDPDFRTRQQTGGCIRLDQTYRYTVDLPRNSFTSAGTQPCMSLH